MITNDNRSGLAVALAFALALACVVAAPAAALQSSPPPPSEHRHLGPPAMAGGPVPHAGVAPVFMPLGPEPPKTVAGAPYLAEAITETTQTLADGNRIQRRIVARVFRDSAGRVRREQDGVGIGPVVTGQERPQVFIHDPVAKTSYVLDPARREAHKVLMRMAMDPAQRPGRQPGAEGGGPALPPGGRRMRGPAGAHLEGSEESLGTQNVNGIPAVGTRWTATIAAGTLGNERPIDIVSEQWFSPELQVVVMAKHSDPRVGETVYQLLGLARDEPAAELFTIPSDYKVIDAPRGPAPAQRQRVAPPPPEF